MNIDWKKLADAIAPYQRFLLTSHVRPDCDALGSELAMAALLRQMGKEATIVNASETPPHLGFIDPTGEVRVLGRDVTAAALVGTFDALMVVDTGAWIQLAEMGEVLKAFAGPKFVLDHHVSEDDLGAQVFKDSTAEATGRLVYEAAQAWGLSLDPQTASQLFTAIATDTGWFRFSSVTSGTYRAIAGLVDADASPAAVYADLYERDRLARVLLRGRILSKVVVTDCGRLAYSTAVLEDFEATGSTTSDTEDAINMMLVIQGVQAAVLFIELPDGGVKASFRSRSSLDVSQVAGKFGGGGHKAAAGATISKSLKEAMSAVLPAMEKGLQ
ncbi:DHH family phosphoesterase [Blastopirellula sp. JC732]|uniref:DHH family phosphoesterase n=1 Tax=Blastopirellula sediminis TaxID=2894196 RepID=A0A9X1SIQ7_9BACT|nr:DHH family phosphoesterase [Blastopirellula sediminis]MCC9605158.1 DHH family phosphoesterase [Blastopirellula sediminis]MCC9631542.1 DHH family phosphoesterase [Blastopirellula sediminis]